MEPNTPNFDGDPSKEERVDPKIKKVEEEYPIMCNEFKRIQREDYRMFCLKQYDYGPSNIAMGTPLENRRDVKRSLIGICVRMNDKIQRIMNITFYRDGDSANEPLIDAFADSAVYGIIARLVNREKWGK